ncbi:MAG: hypothetical protein ABFD92_07345 [Planctomycetaceae bacterium]|nr:hypothetical protein [Planctomycetaceae bacterium]
MDDQTCDAGVKSRLSVALAMAAAAILAALLGMMILFHIRQGESFNFTREDGLVEWGTVASFMLCALLAIPAAMWMGQLARRQRVFLIVFAILCIVAAGEELSWGQRFFGFAPPKSMESRSGSNVRFGHNDVTVHNLTFEIGPMQFSIGSVLFKLPLVLGSAFHGILLPLALRKGKPWARRFVDKLGLFVPSLPLGSVLFIGVAVLYFVRRLFPHSEVGECREFYAPTLYLLILIEWLCSRPRAQALAPQGQPALS